METQKTVKVNETQIRQSTEKAKKQAGSDDIEQAVANFRYDLGDVESERNMLAESKQAVEKEVFKNVWNWKRRSGCTKAKAESTTNCTANCKWNLT